MYRGAQILLALAIVISATSFASIPALGYDVAKNAPNCSSRERVAERLTGDASNKRYFVRLTERGVSPAEFQYSGPMVDIQVRRDYVVSAFGAVFTQRQEATLSDFYVSCYDRLDLPYTYYWAPQSCLDLGLGYSSEEALVWYTQNLGGRRNSWSQIDFNVYAYSGPVALFTVPMDAIVRDFSQDGEFVLTPGYQVWSGSFTLTCYAHQYVA